MSTNKVTIHYAVGAQQFLDITELPKSAMASSQTIRVAVRRPDGSQLLPPVDVVGPLAAIDVAHVVAQTMAGLPDLAFGVNRKPYLWSGAHWLDVDEWAMSLSLAMTRLIGTPRHNGRASNCFYNALLDAWLDQRRDKLLPLQPFGSCMGVPVKDGVVAMRDDGVISVDRSDPSHGNLHVLPVSAQDVFDAWMDLENGLADDSLLMRFLRSSLDADQASLLRRWFGLHLVLHRIANPEKLLFMHGAGGNGKGVVLRLLRALVTNAAVAPLRLQDLRISSNLEKLVGALSMIGAEGNAVTDRELLKTLVSWEPINVNPKYRDPFTLDPRCLVTQASNPDPSFDDDSDGMVRRVIALHMTRQPGPEEKVLGLADKICAHEYPLLVAWSLMGAGEVLRLGTIEIPKSIAAHSERVVRPVRPVDRFVDLLEFGPYEVAADELYAAFKLMCERQKLPLTPKKQFFQDLSERLVRAAKEFEARSKVTDIELSTHINERGEVLLIAPQLRGAGAVDAWFGVRVAEGHFGPPVGHSVKKQRRGLPDAIGPAALLSLAH
jgi:hypothetical protein